MGRVFACAGIVVLLSCAAFGQSAEKPPAVEIADVHVSPPSALAQLSGGVPRGGRYELRNATMVDLIMKAYGVTDDKVAEGPSWLGSDRFDVIAKTPPTVTPETARLMLSGAARGTFRFDGSH